MGWWKKTRWIVFPIFQLLRPVPPIAWIPLSILWLGIGPSARVFVVFIAAIVPWVMNSMQAVYSIDGLLVRAALTLGANDRQILTQIEEALERIEDEEYGVCTNCGNEIGGKRLEALPWVRYCINCQELAEKGLLDEEE